MDHLSIPRNAGSVIQSNCNAFLQSKVQFGSGKKTTGTTWVCLQPSCNSIARIVMINMHDILQAKQNRNLRHSQEGKIFQWLIWLLFLNGFKSFLSILMNIFQNICLMMPTLKTNCCVWWVHMSQKFH